MAVLDQTRIDQFHEQGYLVVEGILDPQTDLQPIVDEYAALLDRLANRWYAEGKLESPYRELPFGHRLTKVLLAGGAYYQYFDISLPQTEVTEETPMYLGPAVFNLLRHPRLLDVVESLVGPEIYSNPVQHVRIKPPERFVPKEHRNGLTAVTDWHQDQGVVLPEADASQILTVWLPIVDATAENGCLAVIPGSHRNDLVTHCPVTSKKQWLHIPDHLLPLDQMVPVPVNAGGALFLTQRTIHCSLVNTSDDIRWSFDLRYQEIGRPTGRPAFPGFVARSRRHPENELRDPAGWAALWNEARARLAGREKPTFNRWKVGSPVCA